MKKFSLTLLILGCITFLAACGSGSTEKVDKIKIGASPTPHAEILEHIKPELKKKGIDLEVVKFDDYVLPNKALDDGEIDANYFSTVPYFNLQKKENGYKFSNVGAIHLEPMGIYSHKIKKVSDISDGAKLIVSNVPSEWGRVLNIFVKNNLIKIKSGVAIDKATFEDITENPKNLVFEHSVDPTLLTSAYENNEGDLVAINSNFAYEKGLNPVKDSLMIEQNDSPYVNIVATKTSNKSNKDIKKIVEVLHEKKVQDWIEQEWGGSVVPVNE
ncbi:MetQ/NlpA family ABC transporter substrate-binding protein [Enterococcus dongliensis]|uniref:MetQ/NlpA family ABC transporter substrate-binding protein n=1 Tax=Enterococcus dongliensis TaxID=2559925 RepID=UPI002890575F|nr:MetQ/NlpA family ABC transporter substrate-binding protein [Enterococcus dongliensis]MDT2702123.1 MetQ/NlpA family ABC transporter substrate-binding protein [Enterococcus dongliensis]